MVLQLLMLSVTPQLSLFFSWNPSFSFFLSFFNSSSSFRFCPPLLPVLIPEFDINSKALRALLCKRRPVSVQLLRIQLLRIDLLWPPYAFHLAYSSTWKVSVQLSNPGVSQRHNSPPMSISEERQPTCMWPLPNRRVNKSHFRQCLMTAKPQVSCL